jgi:hypothetical protein
MQKRFETCQEQTPGKYNLKVEISTVAVQQSSSSLAAASSTHVQKEPISAVEKEPSCGLAAGPLCCAVLL